MRGWVLILLFAFAACGDATTETCELEQERACRCDDGQAGTQTCLFGASAEWSYCSCNTAPIADAGDNLSVPYQTYVKLDGTASHDPDSSLLLYDWELTDVPAGSTAFLDSRAAARPTFFTDRQGTYVARLIVGDGSMWSAPSSVTVIAVQTANAPPIADAGQNATIITGQPYVLNGSASSDPDGDVISYSWAITTRPVGSTTVLANAYTVAPTFTPDVDGTYAIRLVVSDGALTSMPAIVTIETGPVPNTAPIAHAGQDATAKTNHPFVLDGLGSSDPDGDALSYSWAINTRPPGSMALLANPTSANPTLTPDVDGSYEIMLVVSDGALTSMPDTVTITASTVPNQPPVANAGPNATVPTSQPFVLDGTGSADPDGDPLSYSWTITTRPPGSTTALANASTASPTLTPDVDGNYELTLVVDDGVTTSAPDTVTVNAVASTTALPYQPVDAEYSRALDRIIMVAAAPNTLQIYDPVAKTSVDVALPTTPTAVSVSPDGLQAAVGHDAWVSLVDLQAAVVTATHPVTTKALDVVLAGNGYVYVFPEQNQWEQIRCVHLATGFETLSTGGSIYAGTKAKLHPSGNAIYGADNGLSPSDIEKYSLGSGTAAMAYDSPYHGDYPMCGDLWISDDGMRIITRCGYVFRSSSVMSQDMTYNGSLSGVGFIRHAAHASIPSKILAIPQQDDTIRIYDYAFLNFEKQVALPKFIVLGNPFTSHGRFVFSNSAGTSYYVVVQADASAGLLNDHGVVAFSF